MRPRCQGEESFFGRPKLRISEIEEEARHPLDRHPTAVVLLQPLVFLLQPPKAAPVVLHAPASRGRVCCRRGLTTPTIPTAGQALRRRQPHTACSRTSEPSYSSPRGLPLPRLPRLPGVPFLSLAVVHCLGALGAAWSMWSTTDFHRKSTVRGEADNWVHGSRMEVPPYYAQNNYSCT